jgi:flagellar biosynthetic protein FliQ
MIPDYMTIVGHTALYAVFYMAGPPLITALAVGLVIGVVQAATSINEMTLSFIPKLILVMLSLVLFGNFMLSQGSELFRLVFGEIQGISL